MSATTPSSDAMTRSDASASGSRFRALEAILVIAGSLAIAGAAGVSAWNIRKGFKISKQIAGERLLPPKEYAEVAAYALGAMILWAVAGKALGRRIRPVSMAPAAAAGLAVAFVWADEWTRETFGLMVWFLGLGWSAGLIAWDLGAPARLRALAPGKLRRWTGLGAGQRNAGRWAWLAACAGLAILQTAIALWSFHYMDRKLSNLAVEAYDFANLRQSMWTLANQGVAKASVMRYTGLESFGYRWWAEHFTPIQFFLLPFYAPFQTGRSLLVLQYIATILTVFPLLAALRLETRSRFLAFALTLAYALHPFAAQTAINDFHYEMFYPLFFFGAYYFYARRRPAGFVVLLAAAFSTKETIAPYVFFWGLALLLFDRERRRWGALMAGLSLAYFVVAAQMVIPWHRGGAMSRVVAERYNWIFAGRGLEPFESLGDLAKASLFYPADVAAALLTPGRRASLAWLLAPLGFLCLARPWTLLIFLPAALINILSSFQLQAEFRIYHALEVLPLAVVATAAALRHPTALRVRGRRRRLNACLGLALLIAVWGGHRGRSPLPTGGLYPKHPPFLHRSDERAERLCAALRTVPSDARIATAYMLCAPLSGREWLFHTMLPPEADVFIAAKGYLDAPPETVPGAAETMRRLMKEALRGGRWRLARPYDPELGLLWLERGGPGPSGAEIEAILADWAR
jgi:uncharacterized membrane protein